MKVTWRTTVRYWAPIPLGKAHGTFTTTVEAPENDLQDAALAGVKALTAWNPNATPTRIDVMRLDEPTPVTAPDERQMTLW